MLRETVSVAVDGEPAVTAVVPTVAPSTLKLTVPEGYVVVVVPGEMVAVSCSVLPTAGAVVAGVTVTVGVLLPTVSVNAVAVAVA